MTVTVETSLLLASQKMLCLVSKLFYSVHDVAFRPDGEVLAVAAGKMVQVCELNNTYIDGKCAVYYMRQSGI